MSVANDESSREAATSTVGLEGLEQLCFVVRKSDGKFLRGDIAEAADKMKFCREQAEKAMRCAAQAEWRLRHLLTLPPNA